MTIKIKKQGGATKATSKVLTEIGTLGLRQSEGQIEEEWMRQLQGDRKIRALKTMETSDATAFAAVQMTNMAVKQVKFWYNAAGETDADTQAREFATECTFEDMEDHWLHYLDEWLTCVALGYSVAEQVFKIRGGPDQADPSRRSLYDDGKIGWKKFAFRPQETLDHWEIDPVTGEVLGMWQLDPVKYERYFIPREKMVHFIMNATKGNPEGVSQLRGAYPAYYKKHKLEEWELIHIQRNVAGVPKGILPAKEFNPTAEGGKSRTLAAMEKILQGFYLNEDAWFCLPSDVYPGTSLPMVDVKLTADQQPNAALPTTEAINRYQLEIARSLHVGFMLLGGTGPGSYALSESQSDFFVMFIESICDLICEVINRQAIPQLFKLNTWTGLSGLPKLVHGDVAKTDAVKIAEALANLMRAGAVVFPNDELLKYVYDELGVPRGEGGVTETPTIAETTGGTDQQTQSVPVAQKIAKRRAKLDAALVGGVGPSRKIRKSIESMNDDEFIDALKGD